MRSDHVGTEGGRIPGEQYALAAGDRAFAVTRASRDDVPAIVELLADDPLGAGREGEDRVPYLAAFDAIDQDPAQFLAVVHEQAEVGLRAAGSTVVATLQLTLIPGLSRGGATRLQIEAVRVGRWAQGIGLGTALLEWAHAWGAARGARLAQLTTDTSRTEAQRFYERAGYTPSHIGMKRSLP